MLLCRCGSDTHLMVTHFACPLNPKNQGRKRKAGDDAGIAAAPPAARARRVEASDDSDTVDNSSSDSSEEVLLRDLMPSPPFPFPVGTRVAVKFSGQAFAGKITKILRDPVMALVLFDDGDQAEYDADEIRDGQKLYNTEFANK